MSPLEETLMALIPGLVKLIESALADTYDADKELQALLNMQRALADQRVKNALASRS